MRQLLLVCLGGALGTGARYLLVGWTVRTLGDRFPYGTLFVNVLGSFLLAAIVELALARPLSEVARTTLTIGVLGGFTTYSSFNQETLRCWQGGDTALALLYLFATLALCLGAGLAGGAAARSLVAA